MMLVFYFFFSSRRRHTRWNCDWSSDVCSSDLVKIAARVVGLECLRCSALFEGAAIFTGCPRCRDRGVAASLSVKLDLSRSEERRVGKECRCGRWAYHYKEKVEEVWTEHDDHAR